MPLSLHSFDLSVIIPVYNGGENLRRCLASLEKALPAPIEIIVVTDGEGDGAWRVAEYFKVRLLRIDGPGGPARARNMGAEIARGEIFLFLDSDVSIYPDTIGKIAVTFQKHPHLAAVFGSYDDDPFETNFTSRFKNLFHHHIHQTSNEIASTFWGACGAIRKDVFRRLGGFDERYKRPSIEDIELGLRLKEGGYPVTGVS